MGKIDREFRGDDGTVLTDASLGEEQQPENHSQGLDDTVEKLRAETEASGGGVTGAARALWKEADRQFAGEYERREDADATASPQAVTEAQRPPAEGGA